jgi:hypothetical protein
MSQNIRSTDILLAQAELMDIYTEAKGLTMEMTQHPMLGYKTQDVRALNELHAVYDVLSMAEPTAEGEVYTQDSLQLKGTVGVNPVKYTQSVLVSEEALRFGDRWDIVKDQTAALYPTVDKRMSEQAFGIFKNGFLSTSLKGVDGEPLFSASHVLTKSNNKKAGTYSNTLGTAELSYANYVEARKMLNKIPQEDGTPSNPSRRKLLVCAEDNREIAEQLVKAPGIPTSPNLSANNFDANVLVTEWIGDKQWFLIDLDRAQNYFILKRGWDAEMKFDEFTNRGVFAAYISVMFQYIFSDAKFVVGSNAV